MFGESAVTGLTSEMRLSEIQLGLQVHRDYNGGLLFARGGWEMQRYDMPLGAAGGFATTLSGLTFSVGLQR